MDFIPYIAKIKNVSFDFTKENILKIIGDIKSTHFQEIGLSTKVTITVPGKILKPVSLKKYDVFMTMANHIPHPCVVYKVMDGTVLGLVMTSNEKDFTILKVENSRFFEDKYFTKTIVSIQESEALPNFAGIFDNRIIADKAFLIMKNIYKQFLK